MAIYNNREVQIVSPIQVEPKLTDRVQVRYLNGDTEVVDTNSVAFTEDEKKSIRVVQDKPLDAVKVASTEDVKLVRQGIAPSTDSDLDNQAMLKVRHEQNIKVSQEQNKKAEDAAKKRLDDVDKQTTPKAAQ